MKIDRRTMVAAVSMVLLTTVFAGLAYVALIDGGPTRSDQLSTLGEPTITVIENGSMVVIHLDVSTSVSGDATGGSGSGGSSPSRVTTAAPTVPSTSGGTTSVATSVATTVVTPTSGPVLRTVSGWPIPSNYYVPSKWWGAAIPDYPLGNWTKCALEDDGWACEMG